VSFVLLVQVTCDTEGCTASHWGDSTADAWRIAREDGWRHDGEQHRCAKHAPASQVVDTVRSLAARGWPDGRIGAEVGLSRGGVQSLRQRHGIAGRRTGRPSTRVPP